MPSKATTAVTVGLVAALAVALPLLGTASAEPVPEPAEAATAAPVWADDFDGPAGSRVDAGRWAYDLGYGEVWGNNEYQTYTDSTDNVRLDGAGHLVITARKGPGDTYTSGRIRTEGTFSQRYGRFEARIRIPRGPGLLPAFWMMGDRGDWPANGEIDVMENVGDNPRTVYGTVHGPGYSEEDTTGRGGETTIATELSADFHTYAIQWAPDRIDLMLDGVTYKTVTPANIPPGARWVFNDQPFYMLLNVAVGGDWPGAPHDEVLPQEMIVDYVRVYAP